ncbi:MAG: NAD-dependent epimerase/dehydratase family protein [Pirellulales bacterium]
MATDQTSQPSSAPARYLVTGASGLVGNNVVRTLLQAGNSVRVLARKTTDPRPFEGLPIEFFWADLATAPDLTDACQGVDVVIHAAGHVHMGWSELDKHHQINVIGTRKIATAARGRALNSSTSPASTPSVLESSKIPPQRSPPPRHRRDPLRHHQA